MIVLPVPWYRPLENRGEWRLSVRWVTRPRLARLVAHFEQGTVYQIWVAWVCVKLMVKA